MPGTINGIKTSFLIDTGAGVSLLQEDHWKRANLKEARLEHWSEQQLVGVDGTPLHVLGSAHVNILLSGRPFCQKMIIVRSLTTEAILGLDFLQMNQAIIDLERQQISFQSSKEVIPLGARSPKLKGTGTVCAIETITLPPCSEREVMGQVKDMPDGEVWLLEETTNSQQPVPVARALVSRAELVPVRLLNYRPETVTIYQFQKLAVVEGVVPPVETTVASIGTKNSTVSEEKKQTLWKLVEASSKNLTREQIEQLHELLLLYADVFACDDDEVGRTNKIQHTIYTDAPPIRQAVRRIPPIKRQEVQKLLSEMQERDVIEPSSSPWASPIVLVKKKDGSTRFCVDYRKLNSVTRKDAYPLPRIDDTLSTLAGAKWFSTLDLISGYWQVEVDPNDRSKTAFCTTEGLFQFKVMPFGLCNAPATFQRLMDLVLAGLQWSHCLVYLDDVIILGRSFVEHLHNLQAVFKRLREAGLKLKPSKCSLLQQEVQYLGHVVTQEGVLVDPSKVEKVQTWPVPQSVQEVRQFLGFCSYYRRFIQNFAQIAKPLHRLTEKNAKFNWTAEAEKAFEHLRKQLSTTPVLVYPDFEKEFILDTDASDSGIGAVLSQVDSQGRERVIAYGSRLLSKPERHYCVTRRELLAVVFFTNQFRPFLLGRHFLLRTDHGALTWLMNFKEPEGQMARWLEKLQEFNFEIMHRRGKKHTNADALSRLPCKQCGFHQPENSSEQVIVSAISLQVGRSSADLRQLQLDDPTIKPVLMAKDSGDKPAPDSLKQYSPHTNRLFALWDQLVLIEEVLYRHFVSADGTEDHPQLVVPKSLQENILRQIHDDGHLGQEKTLSRIKQKFYWPGHFNDIKNWCNTCVTCAAHKTSPPRRKAALQTVQAGYPLQLVAVDILGPLPESESGNSYLLVVGDYFTRWMEAYPIPNMEATTVAKTLTDKFFCRFGIPEQLHSDQGKQFESQLLKDVCTILRIDKTRTTPYHPQSDGLVERFNRTLVSMLSTTTDENPFEWEYHVQKVCMAYNTSVQSTTGFTPFFLMFGREARLPVDLLFELPKSSSSVSDYVTFLTESLNKAYELARVKVGMKQQRQTENYNQRIHGKPFSENDLVWLHNPRVPRGSHRKLRKTWNGPYKVVKRISDQNYRIKHTMNGKRLVVHFNRLKFCNPNMRCNQDTQMLSSAAAPPTSETAVGSNVEVIDAPEMTPTTEPTRSSRSSSRIRHPPARYNDFIRHDTRVRDSAMTLESGTDSN